MENKIQPAERKIKDLHALVVDDDEMIHDFVELALRNLGIENIYRAISGRDALSLLRTPVTIDIVLCDLNMPHMDGLEFLRHLSSTGFQGSILLMSGEDARILRTASTLARAHNLDVLGYLQKPFQLDLLKETLAGLQSKVRQKTSNIVESISEFALKDAIKFDQFSMVYQPKVDLQTGRLIGVESLARWLHPEKGSISPVMFIAAAEEFGLINELTDILFIKAFEQAGSWQRQGIDITLGINLSVDSLNRLELPEYLVSCAAKSGVDINKVMIEITESRLMSDVATSLEVLSRFCLKGLSLSIDDFGTGYSTMEQLQRIPFVELKVDRSFVTGASQDASQRAILESSIELAKKLGMRTVAEGIETQEDWEMVSSLGCDIGQGYFIARPMDSMQFVDWLSDWNCQHNFA